MIRESRLHFQLVAVVQYNKIGLKTNFLNVNKFQMNRIACGMLRKSATRIALANRFIWLYDCTQN